MLERKSGSRYKKLKPMESRIEQARIDELLAKYWNGETSLDEEEELKAHFSKNPSLAPTGLYFRSLNKRAEVKTVKNFQKPGRWFTKSRLSIAATIAIGVTVGAIILQDAGKRNEFEINDPEEAYRIAQTVLMKMSSNLNEAELHTGQLKKLNKAEELIKEEQL